MKGFTFCSSSMFAGLIKYLCKHDASADAQAEDILSNETRERNVSQTVTSSWGSNSILNDATADAQAEDILSNETRERNVSQTVTSSCGSNSILNECKR